MESVTQHARALVSRRTLLRGVAGTALAASTASLPVAAAPPIASLTGLDLSTISEDDAFRIMATQRPFLPTNGILFNTGSYGAALPYGTSASAGKSDADLFTDLMTFLGKRFGTGADGQAKLATVTQLFNDPNTQLIVPSARLRCALLSLTGTYAEPAIKQILQDAHTAFMDFQIPPYFTAEQFQNFNASTQGMDIGGVHKIYIHPKLVTESPISLAPLTVHEATRTENTKHNAFPTTQYAWIQDAMQWASILLTDPLMVSENTSLARHNNLDLYEIMNGRKKGDGKVHVNGDPVPLYLGTADATVGTYVNGHIIEDPKNPSIPDNTPIGPFCRQLTINLTGGISPASDDYVAAIQAINDNLALFTSKQWLQLAQILQLDVSPAAS